MKILFLQEEFTVSRAATLKNQVYSSGPGFFGAINLEPCDFGAGRETRLKLIGKNATKISKKPLGKTRQEEKTVDRL